MVAVFVLVLCLLAASKVDSRNTYPTGFDINTILSCAAGDRRLGIQPRQPGQVWLPYSGRRFPPSLTTVNERVLVGALGDDLDPRFSQTTRPSTSAEVHLQNSMFTPQVANSQLPDSSFNESEQAVIRRWASVALGCQISAEWTDLGPGFWPRWFTGRVCNSIITNGNCSVPSAGQVCHPDYRESDLVNVMTWDCCWQISNDFRYNYACGWRKAQFQLPRGCMCSCDPVPIPTS